MDGLDVSYLPLFDQDASLTLFDPLELSQQGCIPLAPLDFGFCLNSGNGRHQQETQCPRRKRSSYLLSPLTPCLLGSGQGSPLSPQLWPEALPYGHSPCTLDSRVHSPPLLCRPQCVRVSLLEDFCHSF